MDVNEIAKDKPHCDVGSMRVSPDHSKMAYSVDFSGNEVYEMVIVDLATGESMTKVEKMSRSVAWGADNATVFYKKLDPQLRPYQLWRHKLNSAVADEMLFEENDEQYWLGMGISSSGKFLLAETSSSETSEIHYLNVKDDDDGSLAVIQPRTFGLRYEVEHDGGNGFLLWTNKDGAIDSKLMFAPVSAPSADNWEEVIPYDPKKKIADVTVFESHIVIEGREGGLTQLWLLNKDPGTGVVDASSLRQISFDEELFEVAVSVNKDYATDFCRITYSSLTTPCQWLDLNMNTDARVLIKEQPVLNFDREKYEAKRILQQHPTKRRFPSPLSTERTFSRKVSAPPNQRCCTGTVHTKYASIPVSTSSFCLILIEEWCLQLATSAEEERWDAHGTRSAEST